MTKIKLPVMCGLQSHAFLQKKVDAVLQQGVVGVVELDCSDTVFTTSGFCRFVIALNKKVKEKGSKIRLINVRQDLYDGLRITSLDQIVDVERMRNG